MRAAHVAFCDIAWERDVGSVSGALTALVNSLMLLSSSGGILDMGAIVHDLQYTRRGETANTSDTSGFCFDV